VPPTRGISLGSACSLAAACRCSLRVRPPPLCWWPSLAVVAHRRWPLVQLERLMGQRARTAVFKVRGLSDNFDQIFLRRIQATTIALQATGLASGCLSKGRGRSRFTESVSRFMPSSPGDEVRLSSASATVHSHSASQHTRLQLRSCPAAARRSRAGLVIGRFLGRSAIALQQVGSNSCPQPSPRPWVSSSPVCRARQRRSLHFLFRQLHRHASSLRLGVRPSSAQLTAAFLRAC